MYNVQNIIECSYVKLDHPVVHHAEEITIKMKEALKLHQGRVTRVEEPTASLKGRKENESLMLSQCGCSGEENSNILRTEDDLKQGTTSGAQSILGKKKFLCYFVSPPNLGNQGTVLKMKSQFQKSYKSKQAFFLKEGGADWISVFCYCFCYSCGLHIMKQL